VCRRARARGADAAGVIDASILITMINAQQIKPHMPVVCSNNGQFAVVDHLEGTNTIKLAKDKEGKHHYIPLSWVTTVDDKVHVDRPGKQAMAEWSEQPPSA
jgi:hypothetical protein